jgi:hypothetical protein
LFTFVIFPRTLSLDGKMLYTNLGNLSRIDYGSIGKGSV